MTDTLRSIAEGMEHEEIHLTDGSNLRIEHRFAVPSCPKCRLEALLAEYEKIYDTSYDATRLQCAAAQLETWLAVNLERLKAQAERDGATKVLSWAARLYCQCEELAPLKCSIHNFMAELDDSPIALEAQAKEKP